jgi:hypothetical protein
MSCAVWYFFSSWKASPTSSRAVSISCSRLAIEWRSLSQRSSFLGRGDYGLERQGSVQGLTGGLALGGERFLEDLEVALHTIEKLLQASQALALLVQDPLVDAHQIFEAAHACSFVARPVSGVMPPSGAGKAGNAL